MHEPSTKPYLIRALHEWCTDNGYTPHVVVTVDANTLVPLNYVRDGQITLNIGVNATNRLSLGNEHIEFQARFGGVVEDIVVPISAVSAIYARETGAGMGFEVTSSEPGTADDQAGAPATQADSATRKPTDAADKAAERDNEDKGPGAPHLTLVK